MPETVGGGAMHADLQLASTLESVNKAEDVVMEAARELGFDPDNQHDIGMSVRECMVNAVAHGNRYSGRKKVNLRVWKDRRGLTIEIGDEGKGFEPKDIPDPREGDNLLRQSGRGVLMMQAFMDEFEIVRREPTGTLVRMVKLLRPAPQ